jgi:hypothetical protein
VGESSEWASIENRAEENKINFCKALNGKPLSSALYGMYTGTLNEMKAVLKRSAQEGQSGAVNKTSVESTTQGDNSQGVKRRKKHVCNDTSQTTKKSTKTAPTSTDVKMSPKIVLNRNLFTSLDRGLLTWTRRLV